MSRRPAIGLTSRSIEPATSVKLAVSLDDTGPCKVHAQPFALACTAAAADYLKQELDVSNI